MTEHADFQRLHRAIDDALAALPQGACAQQAPPLRRQCREVLLLLLHARERVQRLSEAFQAGGRGRC